VLSVFGALLGMLLTVGSAAAAGPSYSSLPVGFTQTLYGVSNARLGGVAFAPDGSPLVSDCTYLEGSLHRFDVHSSTNQGGTALHPESVLPSNAGCGLVNHPDGTLYANTTGGIANLNASTGEPIRVIGSPGNTLGLAVDPQTNHLVYPAADCRYSPSCTLLDLDPTSGVTTALVALTAPDTQLIEGMTFDPTGNFLLLANRAPTPRLTILDRTGHLVQHVALPAEAIGLAVSASAPRFVVTVDSDGTLTRLDFPSGDFDQTPTISAFASGGMRGEGAQVGPDGCLYVASGGTSFSVGGLAAQSSLVQICGGFARPPGVPAAPTASFTASKGRNAAFGPDGASVVAFSSQLDNGTNAAANVISGIVFTAWQTGENQSTNQFVKVQLAQAPQVVSQVTLTGFASGSDPRDFQIRVSTTTSDDSAFTTVFSGEYPQNTRSASFTFAPVSATYVELFVLDNWQGFGTLVLAKFQVSTPDRQGGIASWPYGPPASIAAFSSDQPGASAQNAIDDNAGSFWATTCCNTGTSQFIKVQLGGGLTYPIDQVAILNLANTGVQNFEIRVSTTTSDDSAFTTVFSGTAANDGTNLQTFSFPTVQASYVELFAATGYSPNEITVATFQALTPDGANAARLGGVAATVMASSGTLENAVNAVGPAFAIDSDPTTAWETPQTTNQFLKLSLTGEPLIIDRVELLARANTDGIKDFQVRVSDTTLDDSAFTTIVTATLPEDGLEHWYTFPPVQAKYVELFIVDNYGWPEAIVVQDFEVYSPARGGAVVPFLDLSTTPNGAITARSWDFGDGSTSAAQYPSHTYAAPGTYTVTLTVTDTLGLSSSTTGSYTVLAAPAPSFTWTPTTPNEGSSATFTDTTPGVVTSRQWQAFDAVQGTTSPIGLFFRDNGVYPVTLTDVNGDQISASLTQSVTALNVPPTVSLTSPLYAAGGEALAFPAIVSDPGQIDNVQCSWDFGDGTTGTGCSFVSHTYPAPPTIQRSAVYTATITATDKDGGVGTATSQVIVSAGLPLIVIAAQVPVPIGVDYYEPTNEMLLSVNFSSGQPFNFELIAADGSQSQFTSISGLTDEVYIATVQTSACEGGFTVGASFTGTGVAGQIAQISPDGTSAQIPWVTLPGETGLLRGGLFQDRYCDFGGDLIVVTNTGNVWRVSAAGVATRIASGSVDSGFLEGVTTVPNDPTTYGPFAGKILAGNEQNGCLYAIDAQGNAQCFFQNTGWPPGLGPESPHIVPSGANFFGVDYGRNELVGAPASELTWLVGDLLVTAENGMTWDFHWDPTSQAFQPLLLDHSVAQWEGSNFGAAGIDEIPPVPTITATPTETSTPTESGTATETGTPTTTGTVTLTPTITASPTSSEPATLTPAASNTPSETATPTVSATPTTTETAAPSATDTATETASSSPVAAVTGTPTFAATATTTATETSAPSATATETDTPTVSDTATDTATFTVTPASPATGTGTATASPTATATASPSATDTPAPTGSPTTTVTDSPTSTATLSATTTDSPTAPASLTASPTLSATATDSPTNTATMTASATVSATSTATPSETATSSPTESAVPTSSPILSATTTALATNSPTPTASATESATLTPSESPTITLTATASATANATTTATAAALATDSATATASLTVSPSSTAAPSATATPSPSASATPAVSSTASATASVTATGTDTPTTTVALTASTTSTAAATPSTTPSPTATATPIATATPTSIGSATATVTGTSTASETPTASPSLTDTPTATATATGTATVTATLPHTLTPTATDTAITTATPTETPARTPTESPTASPTETASGLATVSSTPTPTAVRSATPTSTPTGCPCGTLSGFITDSQSNLAISGAFVDESGSTGDHQTVSRADGFYQIDGIGEGNTNLTVSASGYAVAHVFVFFVPDTVQDIALTALTPTLGPTVETATATATDTPSATPTPSETPTTLGGSGTPSPTDTPTPTPSEVASPTTSASLSPTPSASATPTMSATPTTTGSPASNCSDSSPTAVAASRTPGAYVIYLPLVAGGGSPGREASCLTPRVYLPLATNGATSSAPSSAAEAVLAWLAGWLPG
jgi:PKD repeat protein